MILSYLYNLHFRRIFKSQIIGVQESPKNPGTLELEGVAGEDTNLPGTNLAHTFPEGIPYFYNFSF